jgi:hypothetical protein
MTLGEVPRPSPIFGGPCGSKTLDVSNKYLRLTFNAMPASAALSQRLHVPLAVVAQPLVDGDEVLRCLPL